LKIIKIPEKLKEVRIMQEKTVNPTEMSEVYESAMDRNPMDDSLKAAEDAVKVKEQDELAALIPPTSWAEFKENVQEFRDAIMGVSIDTDPNAIHLLRGNIGRLAESLRKEKQPFLAQILVVIENVLVSIVDAYAAVKQNKEALPGLISGTLAVEEFIAEGVERQEDTEKTDSPEPQGQPDATKE